MKSVTHLYVGKAARVFVFGLVSVLTPIYVATLGYPPLLVGVVLAAIIGGNIVSNLVLARYEERVGRRRFLLAFSLLMLASGVLLFWTASFPLILLACLVGNISTTGTEAGPFQSIEAGTLPRLVPGEMLNRSFGVYNLIGYGASSVGAFAASAPSYFQNSLLVFRSLYLLYGLVGLLMVALYRGLPGIDLVRSRAGESAARVLPPAAKREITKLSALFSIDAFGGGFVSQSLLSYWFFLVYGVSLGSLGIIFLVVNMITAVSTLGASFLADRIGNLRTMVYTHLASNVFLILIPLAGSLPGSLLFLFARQSVSQMDVPTRQAFMASIFSDQERVSAYAITNTVRSVGNIFGSPASGVLLGIGLASVPLLISGFSKILYDGLVFSLYRKRAR
jgi:MFS family permease